MSVQITGVKTDTTFAITLSESAVRALAMIGDFGADALQKAVASTLSPAEAKRHAAGLAEIVSIGNAAHEPLRRLNDARAVACGLKQVADAAR